MKTFRFLGLLGLVMVCLMGFTACSSDDDDDEGGSGSGKSQFALNGQNYSLGYGYWSVEDHDAATGEYSYVLLFWNYDCLSVGGNLSKLPSVISSVAITFDAQGTEDGIPEGTFAPGSFQIGGMLGCPTSNMEDDGHLEGGIYIEEALSNTASLVITKSGNTYTISLTDATFAVDENATSQGSFSYTGSLTKAPDSMYE